ncbi:MAG: peptidoglycan DD-metalloendopeptidase family protein [Anaerolineae bacterium]|nr:peptidoglycan DD-metalloendopeptidase family protein [Anaerolineae bacterium]
MNKSTQLIFVLITLVVLAACDPGQSQQTPLAAVDETPEARVVAQVSTAVPTANLAASRTPTLPPTKTLTPTSTLTPTPTLTPTLTPTNTLTPTITLTPTDTLTPTITNTPVPIASATPTDPSSDPNYTPPPTWTPPPIESQVTINDHYHLRRPIADGGVNWVDRTYPYGGTSGRRLAVHHGVEFVNPRGTPILAAGDGTVLYAGDDLSTQVGPHLNYYGNVVIIQHNFTSPEGLPVFTVYGHMDRVEVETGQTVQQGTQIGNVGATGIAQGPHLHFEVRVGDGFDFGATRNPELWIYPFQTFGTLAGRVVDSNGTPLYDVTLQVESTDITRYAFTYGDASVNGDPAFSENFTLGDLPANYYEVTVRDNGRMRFQKIVYVYPNRTTWVDVELN